MAGRLQNVVPSRWAGIIDPGYSDQSFLLASGACLIIIGAAMKYTELIQLYFERTTALQNYWTLYVVIVGGILAFSSLRKQPAALTTLIVSILFGLFAYENLDAIKATATQRHATLAAIKQSDAGSTAPEIKPVRDLLEPTLNPATVGSTQTTHLISDALTIAGLWIMELRRRKNVAVAAMTAQPFP